MKLTSFQFRYLNTVKILVHNSQKSKKHEELLCIGTRLISKNLKIHFELQANDW